MVLCWRGGLCFVFFFLFFFGGAVVQLEDALVWENFPVVSRVEKNYTYYCFLSIGHSLVFYSPNRYRHTVRKRNLKQSNAATL